MRNTKLEKLNNEIERTGVKLAELQERLSELERQRIELENDEIINFVRDDRISDAELNDFIFTVRRKGKAAASADDRQTQRNKQRTEESKNAKTQEN